MGVGKERMKEGKSLDTLREGMDQNGICWEKPELELLNTYMLKCSIKRTRESANIF